MTCRESVIWAIRSASAVGTPQSLKLVKSTADHPAPLVRNWRPSGWNRTDRTVSAEATAVMRTVSASARIDPQDVGADDDEPTRGADHLGHGIVGLRAREQAGPLGRSLLPPASPPECGDAERRGVGAARGRGERSE